MATLKLTLDKRRKYQDGRSPVVIRLTSNGKSTCIPTGVKLDYSQWDNQRCKVNRKHPNQRELNTHLQGNLVEFEEKLIQLELCLLEGKGVTELKQLLTGNSTPEKVLLREFAQEHIEHLQAQNRFGNAQSFITATNRLIEFAGTNTLINDIDYAFILSFERFLTSKGITANSIAAYMRAVRALLNKAGKLGVADSNKYPFKHYTIRTERTPSRSESADTLKRLHSLDLEYGSEKYHARNIFFLIFGLIGVSFIDLICLKKSDLKDGRISYKRKKTGKLYSIKLQPIVASILHQYSNEESAYLLPQFRIGNARPDQVRHLSNLGLKRTNRYLKQVGKELELDNTLTTYVARYSWANIAKSLGYSKDLIAESLGHNYGNQVTGIYLDNYRNEVVDDANQAVVSSIVN